MTPEQQKITLKDLTPEQLARLKQVLAAKGKQIKKSKPVEYKPTYGELKQAWRAKHGIK